MDTEQFSAPVVCDQQDHVSREMFDSILEQTRKVTIARMDREYEAGVLGALRSLVNDGELYAKYALEAYNRIADVCGWDIRDNIMATYTVTVSHDGDDVLTVEGVEADSPEEATAMVLEHLEVSNINMTFTLSYNGEEAEGSAPIWNDSMVIDGLDAEAYEEGN